MTSLAALAQIDQEAIPAVPEELVPVDEEITEVAAQMVDRGDLYRYTGVKPNHVHAAISG